MTDKEIRPIEYYKEMLEVNPKWLGVQAREMLSHYADLEAEKEQLMNLAVAVGRAAVEPSSENTDWANELWRALPDKLRHEIECLEEVTPEREAR